MENNKTNYVYNNVMQIEDEPAVSSRRFLGNVFMWMFAAMAISGLTVYYCTNMISLSNLVYNPTTGGLSAFGYFAIFSPTVFSLVMGLGFNKFSYPVLLMLFFAFATIMGISLSLIFLVYTTASILNVFVAGAVIFAVMAYAGYYTTMDLSKFRSILIYGMFGVVAASVINFFVGGDQFSYIIGFIGAVVFTGLTAYYMQTLKQIGAGVQFGTASANKLAIMGALSLYITLINLILSLLRIFGRRR